MQKNFTFILFVLLSTFTFSQTSINLLGSLSYGEGLNDIWGYTDVVTNTEYAIVGTQNGVSVVDITTTPNTPNQVHYTTRPTTTHRDIKTCGQYAYITNETSGGLHIMDLSGLPGTVTDYYYTGGGLSSSHNLYIDENCFLYVFGANVGNGGCIILDISSPTAPVQVGIWNDKYIHDGVVRGDTLFASCINDGVFELVDVSNKANPTTFGTTRATPLNFTHNCWFSDDGKTLFTTDERANAFLGSYDISDLNNITELDRIKTTSAVTIPHNTHTLNDYQIVSWYEDGLVIIDGNEPDVMVVLETYDTYPQGATGNFNGAWGAYPYFPSGKIVVSDINNGLFVFGVNYGRASYLEGNVTDTFSGAALNNVQVEIVSTIATENTNLLGDYRMGVANPGTYNVTFSLAGYFPKTITGVALTPAVFANLDVELRPIGTAAITGTVTDAVTLAGIPNAQVYLFDGTVIYNVLTDPFGNFSINPFQGSTYTVWVGKWGYVTKEFINQAFTSPTNTFTAALDPGYYDDFALDFNWNAASTATSGNWVKDEPLGTSLGGGGAPFCNPEDDIAMDIGDLCYMTGNNGGVAGGAGADDVDGGTVTLTSPVFDLSTYQDPHITYEWWFCNDGGQGAPDDDYIVTLSNGITSAVVQTIDASSNLSSWNSSDIRVYDYMTTTANMTMTFETSDGATGHLVEAGLDLFVVVDDTSGGGANIPPLTFDDLATTNEDVAVTIPVLANDADVDGTLDVSSLTVSTMPANGTTTINMMGEVIYTPNPNYCGNDNFQYTICDNSGDCSPGNVSILVVCVNDAPIANNDTACIFMNNPVTIAVTNNDVDVDGDPLSVSLVSSPTNGITIFYPNNDVLYSPTTGFIGNDQFTIAVCDGAGLCDTSTYFIKVLNLATGINNLDNDWSINNYPNPFKGSTNISINLAANEQYAKNIQIHDQTGKLIYEVAYTNQTQFVWGKRASAGIYYFSIGNENNRVSKKLLKIE